MVFYFKLYWYIIDLQCCVSFIYITEWFSYAYTYISSFFPYKLLENIEWISLCRIVGPCGILCLTFWRTVFQSYAPVCSHSNSVWRFQFLHILAINVIACPFAFSHPSGCEAVSHCVWVFFLFFVFFLSFCLFRVALATRGSSQARGPIRAVAASLGQGHSNLGTEPCLWPTPHLTAMPDP